jgi:hypothetical protein
LTFVFLQKRQSRYSMHFVALRLADGGYLRRCREAVPGVTTA